MVHCLHDREIMESGIATLMQCVMVPQSGRINGSAIELMSKMLQIFTLSYPQSSGGPKVMVLFTNFSKTDTSNDSGEFSFDEDEETNEET